MSDIPDDQVPGWPATPQWPTHRRRPPVDLGLAPSADWRCNDLRLFPEEVTVHVQQQPRRRRPGLLWWLLIGWWWRPACWCGRVLLWLVAWPLGLWRSIKHGQRHPRR